MTDTDPSEQSPAQGQPEVRHNDAEHRYEVLVDGALAGLTAYTDSDGRRIFFHTEVDDAYAGRGLAAVLVSTALAETKAAGLRIVPVCPYVAKYVTRHHEVDDVLDPVTPEALQAVRAAVGQA